MTIRSVSLDKAAIARGEGAPFVPGAATRWLAARGRAFRWFGCGFVHALNGLHGVGTVQGRERKVTRLANVALGWIKSTSRQHESERELSSTRSTGAFRTAADWENPRSGAGVKLRPAKVHGTFQNWFLNPARL